MKKKTTKPKKRYWTTESGDDIEYRKLDDKHLVNIIYWIRKRASTGIMQFIGGGWDMDSFWGEEYVIDGEEVLELYDYEGLLREAKRRKLFKKAEIKKY